jgi:predicted aspartyl protease
MKKIIIIGLLLISVKGIIAENEGKPYVFTGPNNTKLTGIITAKTQVTVTLTTKEGKSFELPLEKVSEADRQHIKIWDSEKYIFIQKCRSLEIGELLQGRGYEAFAFTLVNNQIHVKMLINGKACNACLDTGAANTLIDTRTAKNAKVSVGEMKEKIYGVAGSQPAATVNIEEIRLGETILNNNQALATDLSFGIKGNIKDFDILLGNDILQRMAPVISYAENKVFLKPILRNQMDLKGSYRLFKLDKGAAFAGRVLSKTVDSVVLQSTSGKEVTLPIKNLDSESEDYVYGWTKDLAYFLEKCDSLTVADLLELRYFTHIPINNQKHHIFVDVAVNGKTASVTLDTGAHGSHFADELSRSMNCKLSTKKDIVFQGIGGQSLGSRCFIDELKVGDYFVRNRQIVASEMVAMTSKGEYGALGLLGTDFLRELDAVISYPEEKLFLREYKNIEP